MTEAFIGAKLAILVGSRLVAILRDDIGTIPYRNHWDLPGGGREGQETPEEAVLRETKEEIGIAFAPVDLIWSEGFTSRGSKDWMFVTEQPNFNPDRIRFGDEGQCWRMVPIDWFLNKARAVPNQQERLSKYFETADASEHERAKDTMSNPKQRWCDEYSDLEVRCVARSNSGVN